EMPCKRGHVVLSIARVEAQNETVEGMRRSGCAPGHEERRTNAGATSEDEREEERTAAGDRGQPCCGAGGSTNRNVGQRDVEKPIFIGRIGSRIARRCDGAGGGGGQEQQAADQAESTRTHRLPVSQM